FGGVSNAFVTALDTTGQPLYSTYLGGSLTDAGHGIAVDSHDHVYVTGTTSSANFPTQNAGQSNLTGFDNAFVTSLDAAGQPVYSTYLGGSLADYGLGIAVDPSGQAYVTGTTYSVDFPTRAALQPKMAGLENAFVTALDQHGNAYITGATGSSDFPIQAAFQTSLGGIQNAFVTKIG